MALTDNLISYWKLDEQSGNAADSAGSNTLTNNNSTAFAAGKINNGADLESGSSNYFSASDNTALRLLGNFTISCWIKAETQASSLGYSPSIISKENSSGGWNLRISTATNLINFVKDDGSVFASTSTISTGLWYFITVVFDGTNLKVYVNGAEQSSAAYTSHTSVDALLNLGRSERYTTRYFDGIVDEVGIWSRGLTVAEVSQLYRNGTALAYPFTTPTTINEYGISLNGTSQYLTAADSASFATIPKLIEAWVNPSSIPNDEMHIYYQGDSGGAKQVFFQLAGWTGDHRLRAGWNDGTNYTTGYVLGLTWTADTWYHVAVAFDVAGGAMTFYLNGVAQTTTYFSQASTTNSDCNQTVAIGAANYYGQAVARYFPGLIDEVRVWNVTRTQTEINANKAKRIVSYPGLVASWSLDNTLTDSSGNGNTLTNVGSATFSTDVSALTGIVKAIYPEASSGGISCDGQLYHDPTAGTWANLHDASACDQTPSLTGTTMTAGVQAGNTAGTYKSLFRSFMSVDTSEIGSNTLNSATIYLYGSGRWWNSSSGFTNAYNIYGSTQASANTLVQGDYDQAGTTAYSTAIATASISTSSYNAFALNATGLAAIQTAGVTKFAIREANYDAANSAPPSAGGGIYDGFSFYTADNATNKPCLVIDYSTPSSGANTTNFFQFI